MGKGDMKTKRGKIVAGSYGKTRPRKPWKSASTSSPEAEKKTK
ncbi:MAG TPA: 30S ribosomal protein THX [Candidatus Sphingobacterium stercorigallinarum]|nr:30S ribosomal protein THX [Candidatus Sphingobacterium stercorigallinarum]